MSEDNMPWLRTDGLSKRYDGVQAVDDVSVAIRAGEIHGLVGANGAGKSTLIKLLGGAAQADTGSVLIDGQHVKLRRPADAKERGIELMPQEMTVAGHMSVAENVMLGRFPHDRVGRVSRSRTRAIARRALDLLDLDLDLDAPVLSLSRIEQRLVMAARAAAGSARLLMFDEPTAGMAPPDVRVVLGAIRGLAARGVACLYVSHHLDEIVDNCDRVTVLRDGRVAADLSGDETTHAALVELISPAGAPKAERARRPKAAPGKTILRARDLHGAGLRGVSLDLAGGEIVGVAGLAGSGAGELLLTIAGAKRLRAGTVEVAGRSLKPSDRLDAVSAGIGYLPGDRSLGVLPRQSIRENVSLPILGRFSSLGFISRSRERQAVTELADRVALGRAVESPIALLSGGNQQKALVARWIGCTARVLLLDDPTVGVDVNARAEIHDEIASLCREVGLAVLITSSDLDELVEVADRVLVLYRGQLAAEIQGPTDSAAILTEMTRGASNDVDSAAA